MHAEMTPLPRPPGVLLVEDDRELGPLLVRLFSGEGYPVDLAADGQCGLHLALTRSYDIMIIDRRLPAVEGLDLLGRLRRRGVATPALMLTALGTLADRVAGLDAGADDYLVKPFEVEELLARMRALVRRQGAATPGLPVGSAMFDLVTRTVRRGDGDAVTLSGRESDLLRLLAAEPGRVFSREEIIRAVFCDSSTDSVVDTYVHYLRRKLGPTVIRTVRGAGFQVGTA